MAYERTDEIRDKHRQFAIKMHESFTDEENELRKLRAKETVEKRRSLGIRYKNWIEPKSQICEVCSLEFFHKKEKRFCCRKCYHSYRKDNYHEFFAMSAEAKEKLSKLMAERHLVARRLSFTDEEYAEIKREFKKYKRAVGRLTEMTYVEYHDMINPNNYTRTLCGVENGYQLDHIVSIKHGFDNGIDPHVLASVTNLQMLPWKDNLLKGK